MTERLYCYSPQKEAVATLLCPAMPKSSIFPVDEGYRLRGVRRGAFVMVTGHARKIPRDIWEVIEAQGWITVTLDDNWSRRLYAKEATR